MKKKFTDDEKMKIWIHYMVTQVGLNTYPLELKLTDKKPEDRVGDCVLNVYPYLGYFTFKSDFKFKVRDFDSFCSDTNELKSDTLYGWYFRFKHEIFKDFKKN